MFYSLFLAPRTRYPVTRATLANRGLFQLLPHPISYIGGRFSFHTYLINHPFHQSHTKNSIIPNHSWFFSIFSHLLHWSAHYSGWFRSPSFWSLGQTRHRPSSTIGRHLHSHPLHRFHTTIIKSNCYFSSYFDSRTAAYNVFLTFDLSNLVFSTYLLADNRLSRIFYFSRLLDPIRPTIRQCSPRMSPDFEQALPIIPNLG